MQKQCFFRKNFWCRFNNACIMIIYVRLYSTFTSSSCIGLPLIDKANCSVHIYISTCSSTIALHFTCTCINPSSFVAKTFMRQAIDQLGIFHTFNIIQVKWVQLCTRWTYDRRGHIIKQQLNSVCNWIIHKPKDKNLEC